MFSIRYNFLKFNLDRLNSAAAVQNDTFQVGEKFANLGLKHTVLPKIIELKQLNHIPSYSVKHGK